MTPWTSAHGWPGRLSAWCDRIRANAPERPKEMWPNIVFTKHAVERYQQRVFPELGQHRIRRQLNSAKWIVPITDDPPGWLRVTANKEACYLTLGEYVTFPLIFKKGDWVALTCLSYWMFWNGEWRKAA